MQLNLREVSKLLDEPEATVTRWIKQRGLPAREVGGKYRFNRTELLEWATSHHVRVAMEMFDHSDAELVPRLSEALETGGVYYGLKGADKQTALRSLVDVMPMSGTVDRGLLLQLFLAREDSASTAVGDGIAIPHVRSPIVLNDSRPAVTLAFLSQPIEFGALDRKPVFALFSIVSPTIRIHLQLLSRLSFVLHDPKLRAALARRSSREMIMTEIRRVESAMKSPPNEQARSAC
jgi:PTS system nitrogen regulatory IIA component